MKTKSITEMHTTSRMGHQDVWFVKVGLRNVHETLGNIIPYSDLDV